MPFLVALLLSVLLIVAVFYICRYIRSRFQTTTVQQVHRLKAEVAQAEAGIADLVASEIEQINSWVEFVKAKYDDLLSVEHKSVPVAKLEMARDSLVSISVPAAA